MTVQEIADLTGVSKWTVYNRHRDGELPGYRNPRNRAQLIFRKSDVEKVFGLIA